MGSGGEKNILETLEIGRNLSVQYEVLTLFSVTLLFFLHYFFAETSKTATSGLKMQRVTSASVSTAVRFQSY